MKPSRQTVIGILAGVVIAAIFYFLGRLDNPRHQVAYNFSEPSLIVYRAESASSIQVLDSDGKPVEGPIYATKLVIWNSGTETIPYNEVLEVVQIGNSAASRILSKSITDSIEKRGSFTILSSPSNTESFTLQWENFDPGAAVEIQIILEGRTTGIRTEQDELGIRNNIRSQFQVGGEFVKGSLIQGQDGGSRGWQLGLSIIMIGFLCFLVWNFYEGARKIWTGSFFSNFYLRCTVTLIYIPICLFLLLGVYAMLTSDGFDIWAFLRPSLTSPL